MKKCLLSILIATLLVGCNDNDNSSDVVPPTDLEPPVVVPPTDLEPPDVVPPTDLEPPVVIPPTDLEPPVVVPPTGLEPPATATYQGKLVFDSRQITGNVTCGGTELDEAGQFSFTVEGGEKTIQCDFGVVGDLATVQFSFPDLLGREGEQPTEYVRNFNLRSDGNLGADADDALKLLNKISTCPTESHKLCLDEIDSYDIASLYRSGDKVAIEAFLNPVVAEEGEQPSSHVDPDLQPEVTPGASDNLGGSFVSASAEAAYQYVPAAQSKPLTTSTLTDSDGNPLAGIEYFSQSARGVTNDRGEFEYLWGENLVFGIDTFTLGEVKGNKVNYTLADLNASELVQQNLAALVARYAIGSDTFTSEAVRQVFAQYPNVINELINLSLPNGATIEGTGFVTPDEFDNQFSQGLTRLIDDQLKQTGSWHWERAQRTIRAGAGNYVTESLQRIFSGVDKVHIFNDNASWYGSSGYPRLMRNFNLSNTAFPVLMPRTDNNFWQPYGREAAWSRGSGLDKKAYIVDATTLDKESSVTLLRPPEISRETAIYNLPGMAAGLIGRGKVVFLGNAMYTSVLSCPDNYWADNHLGIEPENNNCRYQTPHSPEAQESDPRNDRGSMKTFFSNLITWMAPQYSNGTGDIQVATNIETGNGFRSGHRDGQQYSFFVNNSYNLGAITQVGSGDFGSLVPASTPVLLLQSFDIKVDGYDTKSVVSDTSKPKLNVEDVTDLIRYVNDGGNIIFFDALEASNPEPIARLADAAGVSVGGANLAKVQQVFCDYGYWCAGDGKPNLHSVAEKDIVVYERYGSTDKFKINNDGTITWPSDTEMKEIPLEVATYKVPVDGGESTRYAFRTVANEAEKQAAIAELQGYFPDVPVCKDEYQYEVNCIEVRDGHGIPSPGNYHRPQFTRYEMSPEIIGSMVQAANLGDNMNKLLNHEIYYRSKGSHGVRLPGAELTATYDNLSIWLWNDEQYAFVEGSEAGDELGFRRAVELLNCYTDDRHGGNSPCQATTRELLKQWNMLTADGTELNPSYPLNWMEKPLTRMMLGRSFRDLDISVLTTGYPGRPQGSGSSASAQIHTINNTVIGTAGAMQSTGLWAPQLSSVTVSGGVAATITVALVDDLTGRAQHELALNRPPRVQQSFSHDGSSTSFKVPYGGLIYIQPLEEKTGDLAQFTFTGVLKASLWKDGSWMHPINEDVPLAEIDTGHFVYTTPVRNVTGTDIEKFVSEMNRFAEHASDFYGRDEKAKEGHHRRFTYEGLPGNRHRFVNDIQISIGAAHSGYPVQNASFNKHSDTVPTSPTDDWLLWHEVGHNLAAAPFNLTGSTEVTNNILALYMQEKRADQPQMDRISSELKKVDMWLNRHGGHGWSEGNNNMRLAMFGQLKLWAEDHFDISKWYPDAENRLTVFGDDQGWNMFKLAHRKARGDTAGDEQHGGTNYCSGSVSALSQGDLLMACTSYLSGYDLSEYFELWNPSESKADLPNGEVLYDGGLTEAGYRAVREMGLSKPKKSPFAYTEIAQ